MASSFHNSTKTGRWQRCVAMRSCHYGEHKTTSGLAQSGGAEIATHGHGKTQTVSPIVGGVYTVGTAKRKESFNADGSKLTPKEARVWRNKIKKLMKAAAKASKRAAKRKVRQTVSRAKLRAKWAAQDTASAVIQGIEAALLAPVEDFAAAVEALAEDFAEELEAQMAIFDDLFNPPGADAVFR